MTNQTVAITKLKRLKKQMGKIGASGLKARIDFFCTAVGSGLKKPLTNYEIFDAHGLGDRDLDTCFEMYDGNAVIHGIIAKAQQDPQLEKMIKHEYGQPMFDDWTTLFQATEEAHPQSQQMTFF